MTDDERIDALLDLIDPERLPVESRGPQLAVLGLAVQAPKGGFRPTTAGWSLLGARGRAFRSNSE